MPDLTYETPWSLTIVGAFFYGGGAEFEFERTKLIDVLPTRFADPNLAGSSKSSLHLFQPVT